MPEPTNDSAPRPPYNTASGRPYPTDPQWVFYLTVVSHVAH